MAVSHHPMSTNQTARARKPGPCRGAMTTCDAWALTLTGAVDGGTTTGSAAASVATAGAGSASGPVWFVSDIAPVLRLLQLAPPLWRHRARPQTPARMPADSSATALRRL